MRFFSKPHIFTAISNILDPQIILFYEPPCNAQQQQNRQYPKAPTCEPVVAVTHAHRHLHLHLIRHAVVNVHVAHFVKVLKFEQRICHEYCVAFFAYISRHVHAISARQCVMCHAVSIFRNRHDLWRFARIQSTRANY